MGQVIQRTEVDELPVVARTFGSLALLTPTVQEDLKASASGLSIAGQRGFNNNILVDGVTNRSSIRGDQLIAFSQDGIDEFRVSTGGYGAEFGSASGGIINVVTRSGMNGASLPLGFEISSILTARSGPPYSATTSAPLPLFTRYEPRNRRRGDDFFSWDLRIGAQHLDHEARAARVFLEAFNVLNRANFSAFVANASSSRFGEPSEALAPRRLQIGLRVDF